ncbi:MAG TPA: hypothetical protein VJN92_17460 [Candidatus Acidoferrum sp.]|nr:hypothetical protein [Candidatus Acidoferrum sp.]
MGRVEEKNQEKDLTQRSQRSEQGVHGEERNEDRKDKMEKGKMENRNKLARKDIETTPRYNWPVIPAGLRKQGAKRTGRDSNAEAQRRGETNVHVWVD